jgi:hypothetical protein
MKYWIVPALLGLLIIGMGRGEARAGGCCDGCYRICAAQYNAFSPFCAPALCKKSWFCKKCCYVLECPQPCCPAPCWGMDCGPACVDGPGEMAPPGAAPAQTPAPLPAGPNTGMLGPPYGMPQPMVYPTGYPMNYGYPPAGAAMMSNGLVPLNSVPWYGNPPLGR